VEQDVAGGRGLIARIQRWWFAPQPLGRVAVLRTLVYGFVILDVFLVRPWVALHGTVPGALYRPLAIGDLLGLPTPTPLLVAVVKGALVASACAALVSRRARVAGVVVFALYLEWMVIAFSYGKVDHDRIAFLVALAVLPTAGAARWGERRATEAAGWALRCIQVGVVVTYFASVFAKVRFGGLDWVTGATFMRAVLRRGSGLVEPLIEEPGLLVAGQILLVAFELLSPLLLVGGRVGHAMVAVAFGFHLVTGLAIGIVFWPHLVCLLAFLPLERIRPVALAAGRRRSYASQFTGGP
jgi:hypothetical protein